MKKNYSYAKIQTRFPQEKSTANGTGLWLIRPLNVKNENSVKTHPKLNYNKLVFMLILLEKIKQS